MMKMRMSEVFAKEVVGRKSRLRRFYREEDGSLIVMSLFLLVAMMIITGIAIDLERGEERRTVIQATLDRATLAAADLDQAMAPAEVVKDYMKKAGLSYLDVVPVVEEGAHGEYRRVTAQVVDNMPTMFGAITHINSLTSNSKSQAQESIGNVEVSMVLDISGSMGDRVSGSKTRMDMLKPAATNFVTKVFDQVQPEGAPEGRLSVSIVPYNQQVTLGSTLGGIYNLSTDHTKNTCVDVQTLGFNALSISPTATLQRTMFGDSFDYWGNNFSLSSTTGINNCPNSSYASVLAFEDDEDHVIDKIDDLEPGGDTAIDVGARWGLALLDPSARPVTQELIDKDKIGSAQSVHPMDYAVDGAPADETALKILVLLTDGQNTRSFSTKMAYRQGASGFYSARSSSSFSTSNDDYYALYWHSSEREASGKDDYYSFATGDWVKENETGYWYYKNGWRFKNADAESITWQTIWGKNYTLQYFVQKFLYPARKAENNNTSQSDIYDEMAIQSQFSTKDTNLNDICTLAKSKGIRIFTLAVDAPDSGAAVLSSCATGPGYAYEVTSDDMTDAFSSIASSINALRLTN
ncbi:TadE/TadG family type IV pilus assembly protein [Thioclava sp.]|uniref:TadE/TadG family type IV pilus assembly protein n=1 Tax=Thioclava sp. TaxID=1933450 RepID=UPI003AA9647E